MDAEKVNWYEACDKAIREMDRENLKAFGKLKLANWDQVHVLQTVLPVYRTSAKKAKKHYWEIGFEAYLLGLLLMDIDGQKANRMAEKAITKEWVEDILEQTDFVTLYRFDSETERKAYRLAEALEATADRNAEIDKALRFWSKQVGQYAINVTDYAVVQALEDAGVEKVMWITMRDERVCRECGVLHGQVFPIDEVPRKPHWACRCRLQPVK